MSLQGNLKTLYDHEYQKLKRQILENGFSFAVHVWADPDGKYHILDGHQRCEALRRLREEGVDVGDVPCVTVEAKSKAEAVKKLLGAASQFGTFHVEHIGELAEVAGLEIGAINDMAAIPGLTELMVGDLVEEVNNGDENEEWVGDLPEFTVSEKLIKLTMVFKTLEEREAFVTKHQIEVTNKMCGQWTSAL